MEKKTKKKSKFKEIRSAVTMMCVMVAMMSTATYAWFTLTSSPTVAGLQMVAASSGGLLVSDKADTGFVNALELPIDNANAESNPISLIPVTPQLLNGSHGFSLPKYVGGNITGLQEEVFTDGELEGYVAKYTYYIKAEEGTVGVGIITGDPDQTNEATVTNNVANAAGTFVRQNAVSSDQATENAANAIRLGLVVTDVNATPSIADMIIYEPNNDKHYATQNPTFAASTVVYDDTNFALDVSSSYGNGTITKGGTGNISNKLFDVGTDAKKVTMYIWLEGTDQDCIDQIKADELEAQIQFTIVEETVTP